MSHWMLNRSQTRVQRLQFQMVFKTALFFFLQIPKNLNWLKSKLTERKKWKMISSISTKTNHFQRQLNTEIINELSHLNWTRKIKMWQTQSRFNKKWIDRLKLRLKPKNCYWNMFSIRSKSFKCCLNSGWKILAKRKTEKKTKDYFWCGFRSVCMQMIGLAKIDIFAKAKVNLQNAEKNGKNVV